MGKVYGTLTYLYGKEGFAEVERKSLPYLCTKRVGVWQRDIGNEGRGYAKTRKNREDDDVQCERTCFPITEQMRNC
jgi:hypothetical protein